MALIVCNGVCYDGCVNSDDTLTIYTDGSGKHRPRRGGVGIKFIFPDGSEKMIPKPGYKYANIAQMELSACIIALKEALKLPEINSIRNIVIWSDRIEISQNYRKAMFEWSKSKWLLRSGPPVQNAELWKELVKLIKKLSPIFTEIKWLPGHEGNPHNEAVNKLARDSAEVPQKELGRREFVRRKKTEKMTERGSVEMLGQKLTIRIIGVKYLNEQKLFRLRYEVESRNSKYLKNIDFIYSKKNLRIGHSFYVKVNEDQKFPQIEKVYKEATASKADTTIME